MIIHKVLTFVFSDIEHSTRLTQQLKENYPELLERYRTTIRQAIAKYNGWEIDTAGDGFFMTFEKPQDAIMAATDIQKDFHSREWATSVGLKVRMGIHTGEALLTDTGCTGIEVHVASRVCDAAHGGQILISDTTQKLLGKKFPDKLTATDLGNYSLKGFSYSLHLHQLNIPGLAHRFPLPRIQSSEKMVAVLPFLNLSNDAELDYVGDGIAEEIIVALGKVKGLRVISRASAFAFKDGNYDALKFGKKLHVNTILEGSVMAKNGQIRIFAELVDVETGHNLWSEQFNGGKEQLVNIQDEIISRIAGELECELVPEQVDSVQHRQTHNTEAYDFYLRGRKFYLMFSNRGMDLALKMFQKAIEADPSYALAYVGMADCYSFQFQHKAPSIEILDKAEEISRVAIELAPGFAEPHVSRGIVMGLRQNFPEAEKSFQYAVELDPTLFLGWYHYARLCFAAGKLDKAARLFEQANRVEPDDYQSILLAAQSYDDMGFADLGKQFRERGVAIAEKRLELNPGDTRALYLAANALVFLGQREKSLSFLTLALSLEPEDSMLLYNAGCVYALLGMKSQALSCLERAYKTGLTLLGWYENDSNLDSLRNEPRFIELLSQIKAEQL